MDEAEYNPELIKHLRQRLLDFERERQIALFRFDDQYEIINKEYQIEKEVADTEKETVDILLRINANRQVMNVLSDHASPPPEKVSSPFVYWTLGAYRPSSQQTFTMSISSQSQSSSSGTCYKDTPYLDRVRRNVLRLPEYKIREILASLKFQDSGLEPEDPDYEVKVQLISTVLINEDKEKQAKGAKRQVSEGFIPLSQIEHDVRMVWAEDSHKTKEKDNTVNQKESRQQELLSELKEIDKSVKRKRSPESEQSSRSSRERNGLEGLGRTQEVVRIPGTGRGPSLGLDPGQSLGLQDRKKKFQTRVSESKEQMVTRRTRQEVER
ncbi:MAG: hypothetical protein EZS28_013014 [Streblomastix strix]|uniref:Uncharacterized protein n=1 Tax=Streblomastix strix TaxID=222440 RepID=A0A5J4W9Y3_9EUKA|nr:MAG: hypothetical protein EZS28_013014 [Streblomastix strix]